MHFQLKNIRVVLWHSEDFESTNIVINSAKTNCKALETNTHKTEQYRNSLCKISDTYILEIYKM